MNSNNELYSTVLEFFNSNDFVSAEPMLNQLILRGSKKPDVFYMLGTIFYDQGKFKKAIRSFKRSLQLDPAFTDASVGLSIILNDLGKYTEGQEVFAAAQEQLKNKNKNDDEYINERIALKHQELAELYYRYERYSEALEQYLKSYQLYKKKTQPLYGASECFLKLGYDEKAIMLLKNLVKKFPNDFTAHLKLAQVYYDLDDAMQTIGICEQILKKDPSNKPAQLLLNRVQPEEQLMKNPNKEVLSETSIR